MKKLLILPLILFFLSSGSTLLAQVKVGSDEEVLKESKDIIGNLDSLMNLWYLKKTTPVKNRKSVNVYGFKPDEIPDYADSIYVSRLAKLESPLPYTYNDKVKAFINLYAMRKRDLVEKMLGLSEYYFPIFEESLDKHNMPLEIKYLAVVESALNPRAVSRVGATGLWQFMYPTGKMYRLDVSSYVDDRKDPHRSTDAAAQYLKDLHNTFGDWFLAIAAYNCGPGNINKAIRRSGGKRTFWEIYNYLPQETRGYVPAFIAATYVFTYHKEHNLFPQTSSLPMYVDTVYVEKDLDFKAVAQVLQVPEEIMRDLNPQYKLDKIPARSKPYQLRLPSTKAYAFCQFKDSIYVCQERLNPGVKEETEIAGRYIDNSNNNNSTADNSSSGPKRKVYYTVKSRDNISYLADWFDVSISDIKRWNRLRSNTLALGRKLVLYVPAENYAYYKKINTMTVAQKRKLAIRESINSNPEPKVASNEVGKDKVKTAASTTASSTAADKKAETTATQEKTDKPKPQNNIKEEYYVVQKGDTLWSIAQRFPGVSVEDIKKVNNLTDHHSIRIGQKIKIQKG